MTCYKHFYCTDCKGLEPCYVDDEGMGGAVYRCYECDSTVVCDECGGQWTDDHECEMGESNG